MVNFRGLVQAAAGKYAVILADDDFFLDYRYIQEGVRTLQECRLGLLIADCVLGRARRQITSMDIDPVTSGRDFFLKFWRRNYHIPSVSNLFEVALAQVRTLERCEHFVLRRGTVAEVDDADRRGVLRFSGGLLSLPRRQHRFDDHARPAQAQCSFYRKRRSIRGARLWRAGGAPVEEGNADRVLATAAREGHQPTWYDFAEMRATLHLEHEPLGARGWSRVIEYLAAVVAYDRADDHPQGAEPPCNDLLHPTS